LFPQIGLSLVLPISMSLANEGKLIAQSFPAFEISCHISIIVLFAGAVAVFIAGRMGNENKIIRNCIAGGCLAAALITLLFDTSLPQLGRLFSLVASLIGLMVTVYSFGYMTHKERNNVYYSLLLVLFGSLVGLAVSGGLGGFFLYWELMTLSSCILVAWEGTDAAKYAARKYFLMCGMGGAVMWVGLICLSSWTGTLDISSIAALVGSGNISVVSSSGAFLVALLVLVGCGAKAGLVPGHGWLPDAHPAAPSSISAPLSGVLTKAGIFGIVLVFLVIFGIRLISGNYSTDPVASSGVPTIGWIVSILGLATMLYGEYMALKQQDIKRLLAYSTMGQVGEITLTLGMFTALAAAGSLLHLINHAIMKDLLFLCSGALIMRAGSRNLEDLRGLGKAMPLTAACMVVGLISILGLPPFAGFMSKYMMIYSLASIHPLLAAMMLTASLAGVVYYTRIIKTLIFEPYTGPEVKDAPKVMLIPMIILASLCLVLGLCPKISLSLVYPVILSLAGEGKLALQPLPDLMPSFRPYTLVLMFGAILPFIFRRDKVKAGRATALVLAVAAVLVFFDWGRLDTLSLLLAFIVTIVGCINMVYAIGYMDHSHTQWRFYCFFLFMCAGLTGVAASHDLFNFFLFWEIMSSWSLYFVIVHEENADALREGFKYFFFNVLGAAFIFLAVAMLSSWVGSAEFADIHTRLPLLSSGQIAAVIILLAIGFIMKAAQLPFRIDIQMHPATAPTPVSGFISSVLLKSAIYGLIKLFLVLGGTQLLGNIASGFGQTEVMNMSVWVGGITIVMAATYAMLQKDIKLVLIYSTVSQLGYMVVGVSLGTSLGVAGGLLHLVNHVLFKDLLFLVAGAIIVRAHRQNMNQMGGLAKYMPFTMLLFAIGAACVIGIPPSNGFTSKWIIYHALMEQGYVFVAILSLVGSVLTLAYFAKVMHLAFFGAPAAGIEHTSEAPKIMLLPMAVLAAGCVLTSIFPGLVLLPINYILAEFGLETLSIAPWGLASGAGSWNATLTAILLAVVAVLGYYALKRLVGPRRFTPVHSCGIPLKELNIHPTSIDVYTAPVSALASVKTTIKSLYEKIKEPDDLKGPDNFLPEHKKTGSHGE
jgi:formate hydrogenlyase subunit 3/multisubunit Na+/H+ antiporter MnhD subunit